MKCRQLKPTDSSYGSRWSPRPPSHTIAAFPDHRTLAGTSAHSDRPPSRTVLVLVCRTAAHLDNACTTNYSYMLDQLLVQGNRYYHVPGSVSPAPRARLLALRRDSKMPHSRRHALRSAELDATFLPDRKVRFLLLVRSACSKGDQHRWSTYSYLLKSKKLTSSTLPADELYSGRNPISMGAVLRSIL